MKGERAALSLLAIAFLAIHLQIFLFPNGFFAFLHADEIDVLMARAEVRAGQPLVLTHPAGKPDEGGAAALAYLLAPLPLDDPRAATVVLRLTAIALAGATLALWTRFWRRTLGGRAGLVPALLWLFPQEGWISVTIQLQAPYAVSALAAALAANLALPFLRDGGRCSAAMLGGLGAALGALTILCPGAAPACVASAAVVALGGERAREKVRAAAVLFASACVAVLVLIALEWAARGESPLPMLASWALRSGGEAGRSGWYERPLLALTNLFAPGRVWLMGWALFDVLVLVVVLRRWLAPRGDALAGRAMEIHESAAVLTLASHLVTRFAASASYSIVPVLPHLVGLAGAALAGALGIGAPHGAPPSRRRTLTRAAAVGFVAWWVGSGAGAFEERFARRDLDLAYPGIAVARLVAPRLAERPPAPIASTMHWALPLAIHRPDRPSCCIPRSICEVGCEPGFFHGGAGTFVLPGPAAHPHGEPQALGFAARLAEAAHEGGVALAIEVAGADGEWRSVSAIPPDALAVIAEAANGDRALDALLGP